MHNTSRNALLLSTALLCLSGAAFDARAAVTDGDCANLSNVTFPTVTISSASMVSSSGASRGFFTKLTQPPSPPGQKERATCNT